MIIARNMSKAIPGGPVLLSRISFQVDEGDFIAIIGGSGSGKSTLLRCLTLKDRWTDGQYIVAGDDIATQSFMAKLKLKRQWVLLEGSPDLNLKRTALHNVMKGRIQHMPLVRKLTGAVSRDERLYSMDVMEKLGLLDLSNKKVEKLSGGEQQRVAIAKAFVREARLIAADEPVKGLAPQAAEAVLEDLRTLNKREKVTVICTMPQVEYAERYASRIWGLKDGKIVVDVSGRRLTLHEKQQIFG